MMALNPALQSAAYLNNGSLLKTLHQAGHSAALLNAYPPRYFDALQSGYRLPGAIAMAAIQAGIPLKTSRDLQDGQALSADFTGQGWHDHLHIPDIPLITPSRSGSSHGSALIILVHFPSLNIGCRISPVTGRKCNQPAACFLPWMKSFLVLLDTWADEDGLILITSDHGNLEDLSTRRHTTNPVPLILIGASHLRQPFPGWHGNRKPGLSL